MEYTHTYDIKVGSVSMEGDIVFNSGQEPSFTTNAPMSSSIKGLDVLNSLIKAIANVHNRCGGIEKIEFNIKP